MQDPNLSLVVIYESDNPVEIGLATAALEEAGIECAVQAEPPAGYGFGPALNPMSRILVTGAAAEQAGEVLEGLFTEGLDGAEDAEDDERG